jgi:hypothetical protein
VSFRRSECLLPRLSSMRPTVLTTWCGPTDTLRRVAAGDAAPRAQSQRPRRRREPQHLCCVHAAAVRSPGLPLGRSHLCRPDGTAAPQVCCLHVQLTPCSCSARTMGEPEDSKCMSHGCSDRMLRGIIRWDEPMDPPPGSDCNALGIGQWRRGMSFGEFSEATIAKYYGVS